MSEFRKTTIRARGRPNGAFGALKPALIAEACRLLSEGQSDLSLGKVAAAAHVTTALAHYYFKDRDGLMTAIVQEQAMPLLEPLLASMQARTPQPRIALTQFLQQYSALCARHPWLQPCLLQRSLLTTALLDRISATLRSLVLQAQAAQQIREDLPADYIAAALQALCMFPFLPLGSAVDPPDHGSATQLTLHHVALLQDGLVRRHSPRQDSAS
jgi:TetR/AcrR family transcriptional regulator